MDETPPFGRYSINMILVERAQKADLLPFWKVSYDTKNPQNVGKPQAAAYGSTFSNAKNDAKLTERGQTRTFCDIGRSRKCSRRSAFCRPKAMSTKQGGPVHPCIRHTLDRRFPWESAMEKVQALQGSHSNRAGTNSKVGRQKKNSLLQVLNKRGWTTKTNCALQILNKQSLNKRGRTQKEQNALQILISAEETETGCLYLHVSGLRWGMCTCGGNLRLLLIFHLGLTLSGPLRLLLIGHC